MCKTRLDEAAIRAIAGVSEVTNGKQRMEILTAVPERVLSELMRLDPSVSDLEVTASGLEEAFLAITHNSEKTLRAEAS